MAPPAPDADKARLRKWLRQQRASLPEPLRAEAARRIERLVAGCRWLARGRRIGFYVPAKGEVDCLPLLNRALWLGVHCYLPVVPRRSHAGHGSRRLWFCRLGGAARHWSINRYGIPEYVHHPSRVRVWQLQVLFLPLLGFDDDGYRMGMGGGYYDTTLAYLVRRRHWRKPLLVGLAFEAQHVRRLPRDPWDIPLDAVVTERRVYRFARAGG